MKNWLDKIVDETEEIREKNWQKTLIKVYGKTEAKRLLSLKGRTFIHDELRKAMRNWFMGEIEDREAYWESIEQE